MKYNVDGMSIRLAGCAMAMLLLAGVSIYTGLFAKAADTRTADFQTQESRIAVEDVSWDYSSLRF